ncbi:MAG: hypothetical protein ACK55Z_05430 [bacterium]
MGRRPVGFVEDSVLGLDPSGVCNVTDFKFRMADADADAPAIGSGRDGADRSGIGDVGPTPAADAHSLRAAGFDKSGIV